MKRAYVRLDIDKTEFDIMCNHLKITLFGQNDMKNPLVKILITITNTDQYYCQDLDGMSQVSDIKI